MKQQHTTNAPPHLSQADLDNRSRQLDPQQDPYWQSRGLPEKPPNGEVPRPPPVKKS